VEIARAQGAYGVQIGTAFAFCNESGLTDNIKKMVISNYLNNKLEVFTDFDASPTGYPFKVIKLEGSLSEPHVYTHRKRICDLGYLRVPVSVDGNKTSYRCPAEPEEKYVRKGGRIEKTVNKKCLCNGLLANIGLGQQRRFGTEKPLITTGEDFSFLNSLVTKDKPTYTAKEVIAFLSKNNGSF
jgi:NAD(P)H-dependent flavin oxidoreductase YrpB (nitropropane dioxygenase family)